MHVRIVGTRLPGRLFDCYDNVHVGVQRGKEVVDFQPADATEVTFEFDVTIVPTPDGPDFRGPYVHGRRGARFCYLNWGNLGPDGAWTMFRRAKLHFTTGVSDSVVTRLELTDGRGGPRCATVPVEWSPENT